MFGLMVHNRTERNGIKRNEMERNEMKHKFNSIVWIFCEVFRFRTPNWRGRKMRKNDGMEWNEYHHIPLHSIHF
jgi:hypothetical protein